MSLADQVGACTTVEQAVALLDGPDIGDVRIGIVDVDTVIREKAVKPAKARKLLQEGYAFCDVLYRWDIGEEVYGGDAFADEAASIDPASIRCNPFRDDGVMFLADFTGPTAAISPRNLALQQIARAETMGYAVRAAFEYEFFLFDETAATLREKRFRDLTSYLPGNWTYSALSSVAGEAFLSGLEAALQRGGIELDAMHTELGPGCIEAPLAVARGIRAADNAAFFKTFTKAYANQQDKTASFMAKWSDQWPGQSGHMHLSLIDRETGKPTFAGTSADAGPNAVMANFIAGIVAYLPELLAMTAHTANAYRRLVPGAWAPTHACWGVQNRSTSVRVISDPAEAARIEYRVPSADCNPYLALAACLASGLDGIERGLEPPAPSLGDAYGERVAPERRFPRTLLEAAERLQASETARRLFGADFVEWFADSRIREDLVFRAHVSDLDVQRYFEKI